MREKKRENPKTIFDSDSPTVHTISERYELSDPVRREAVMIIDHNDYVF